MATKRELVEPHKGDKRYVPQVAGKTLAHYRRKVRANVVG